jgi:hypothetical protein
MLIDWVQALKPLTDTGTWYWGLDGKYGPKLLAHPSEVNWIYADVRIPGQKEYGHGCGFFTNMHNLIFKQGAVHSFCMECYKVVVCPQSLDHVHKIAEWQSDLGVAGKVGAEVRPYTQRTWGAYFYCRGVEEGRERYKQVREWVDENLGEDVKVFLKRACTEFEQHMGDSDKWEKIPHQDEIEAEAIKVIPPIPSDKVQCEAVKHHVWERWDQWDRDNQPPVTYHEEK